MRTDTVLEIQTDPLPKCDWQGSHSHGKSWKILEKFVVMESQGKVREFGKFVKSHGKGILVMEKSWNCIYLLAMAAFQFVVSRNSHTL